MPCGRIINIERKKQKKKTKINELVESEGATKSKRIHLDGAGCRANDHQPQTRIPCEGCGFVWEPMLHRLQRTGKDFY